MPDLVLAFDIEHSGKEVIGIGATVVMSSGNYKYFNQLGSFFIGIYVKEDTKFSDRCYNNFWKDHLDTLKILEYKGDKSISKEIRERELIEGFQNFRIKWENFAKKNMNTKLVLTSDNNVFDGGLVNELLRKYLPDTEGIPYTASTQEYSSFFETFSQQKGLLSIVDPTFKEDFGLSNRIFELYDIEKPTIKHDHNPVNDAFTIAYDQHVLFGIRDGYIKLRHKN